MTGNDICGAECVDGTPCEHPAGSCPVPSHSDPDAENPAGQPSKFTSERQAEILAAAREGKSQAGCARAAGIDESTLRGWIDRHEEFSRAFRRARGEGESRLVRDGLYDPDTDSSMAKFLLTTSFDYVKTEKRELTGDGGGPVEIAITETIVETDYED